MKRVLWILTASFLLSVISFAADFPDRTAPPSVGEPRPFDLPELQSFQLSNGLEVLLLEKHQVPIVQINLLLEAGRVQEVEGQYGLASLTANLLDEGAGDMSALELADEMSFLGARFGVSSRTHVASINLRVPVGRLPAALGLVSDVLLRPAL